MLTRWGVRTKAIEPGDQLFFIRLGLSPKGIFARATAIDASYRDYHWDKTKMVQGKMSWYVDVRFEELFDPESETIIRIDTLNKPPFDQMNWSIQGSGTLIPSEIAEQLENDWRDVIDTNTKQ